jgi:hypothetical protein
MIDVRAKVFYLFSHTRLGSCLALTLALVLYGVAPLSLREMKLSESALLPGFVEPELEAVHGSIAESALAGGFNQSLFVKGSVSHGETVLVQYSYCSLSTFLAVSTWAALKDSERLAVDVYFVPHSEEAARNQLDSLLRGVIILDLCRNEAVSVDIVGPGGILPNMDLLNVLNKVGSRRGLQLRYSLLADGSSHSTSSHTYLSSYSHLSSAIWSLACSCPSPAMRAFRPKGVHSVRLFSQAGPATKSPSQNVVPLVRTVLDLVFSMNSLNERLHHSYFYYYPLPRNHFVDGETLFPVVFFALVGLGLHAVSEFDSSGLRRGGGLFAIVALLSGHCLSATWCCAICIAAAVALHFFGCHCVVWVVVCECISIAAFFFTHPAVSLLASLVVAVRSIALQLRHVAGVVLASALTLALLCVAFSSALDVGDCTNQVPFVFGRFVVGSNLALLVLHFLCLQRYSTDA